ncbi:nucleotidyl transferase AbiEii/AbiGii toxin family protein [Planctomycetota bacterium]
MTRKKGTNVAASVQQRLLNLAKTEGRPHGELLQHFAMERFLYRLSQSPHRDKLVLKGALALRAWGGIAVRPTRDIDMLCLLNVSVADTVALVRECLDNERVPADGLEFDADSLVGEEIALVARYRGVRVRLKAVLGKARLPLQIDVGFGDVVQRGLLE